ncbi:hypothetical protein K7432_004093 [Basidiobolus ranarum]|uniref:Uncharacterized protein n=1 Tax=Basidiobolus ranarum TaxID=34480 RepID=A0ABR2WYU3_9FUNG
MLRSMQLCQGKSTYSTEKFNLHDGKSISTGLLLLSHPTQYHLTNNINRNTMILKSTVAFTGALVLLLSIDAAPHIVQPLVNLGVNIKPKSKPLEDTPLLDLIKPLEDAPLLDLGGDGVLDVLKLSPQPLPIGLTNSPYSIDLPDGLKFNSVSDIVYEGYASLMRDYSNTCQEAIRRIDREFPNVKNCSDENGLYFSQLDKICSDDCLEATVTASKIIVEACNQEDANGIITDRSYASWSDSDTANAACQPVDYFESKHCLEVVLEANVNRVNLKYKKNVKLREYQEVLCLPCTEDYYLSTRNAENVPSLYFSALDEPQELFEAFEKYCGYQMKDSPKADAAYRNRTEISVELNDKATSASEKSETHNA